MRNGSWTIRFLYLTAIVAAVALLPIVGPPDGDIVLFLNPWMAEIRARGLGSIAGEFSAYTPPYIYLLNLASLLEPLVGTVAAIKLVNVPFVVALALGVGRIVSLFEPDKGSLSVAVALVSPTTLVNAFAWGQADAIYACFLVWCVYFAMSDRFDACAIMFGIALSFKLQAMFLAPLIMVFVIRRQLSVRALMLIPLVYLVMMLPAALAGRPWKDLLVVYIGQADVMHDLSMNSPNPWWFARGAGVDYQTGVVIGLVLGAIAGILIVIASLKRERSPISILLIAAVCVAVMPYVLPKMSSRYFFVADMLMVALAFARPALWPVAVMIQLGSLIAYVSYFTPYGTATSAFVPMTFGVILLVHFALSYRPRSVSALGA